jgi:exopolysaccharide production protein ExoY
MMTDSVCVPSEAKSVAVSGVKSADFQRPIDVVMVLVAVVILLPALVIIAAIIWAYDRGPVFYGHTRIGWQGKTFRCWKFRSMAVDGDRILKEYIERNPEARAEWANDRKLRKDPRITPIGRFIRASSLDELPQLWNVLIGEMSLVGPRPIVADEAPKYGSAFAAYISCRPGITGLWQVSGRNDVSYDTRVALDLQYAETRSVLLNFSIIFRTIPAVLSRRGSY